MTQQQQSSPPIPAPEPQPESDFYWEKCKEEELWLRHCKSCDSTYFYPKGIIHTFSIVHRGPTPPFRDKAPYVPVIVELEEGPRMPSNLVIADPDPANIKIGMAVEVVFEALNDTITLPKFRLAS